MTRKRTQPSLDFVASELAPLDPIPNVKLPTDLPEEKVLRLFLAVNASLCPPLAHLPDVGFDLEQFRRFASVFAGHRIEIPSRARLSHAWEDLRIWIARQARPGEDEEGDQTTAQRPGVPRYRVTQIRERYARTAEAIFGAPPKP